MTAEPPDSEADYRQCGGPVPHVVCAGGGYVALYLARALKRWIRAGRIRLTIVDRENFHCFHGLIPEMLTGKIQPTDVLSSSRRIFAPARFLNAEIESIDPEQKRLVVTRDLDGKEIEIKGDHLVVCMGARDDLTRYPGLAEHAFRLKNYSDSLAVRNHLLHILELADLESDPEERRRLLTVVVAGGNYAGVEVAGELREFLPQAARKHFPGIDPELIRVVLIHGGKTLLPELHSSMPKLAAWAMKELNSDATLDVRCETRIASATSTEAILSNGERIQTRTILSCTGSAPQPVVVASGLPSLPNHRIETDEFCRVKGYSDVWAAGDCGAVPVRGTDQMAPPLAIWAMMTGRQIGRNLMLQVEGKDLEPLRFTGLGDACVLGYRKAVAHLKGIPMTGKLAWLVWRIFMVLYLPARDKKVRVISNWVFTAVFGRDLINLRVHQPLAVAPVLFEPGQNIIREGESGLCLYIIQSGEVEVLRSRDGLEEHVTFLGPGQHFGEVAVFQGQPRTATVRARTQVRLLLVRREAALALSESVAAVGETFRRSPAETAGATETAETAS